MIGDGCLSRYFSNYSKKEVFCLLLTGHTHDLQYYKEALQPIFFREFGIKGCIRLRKDCNATRFETNSKRIFKMFRGLGFPSGLKNTLTIPKSILSNNDLSIACIRGIFDTDGSIYRRYSKKYKNHSKVYNYLVIQFRLNSERILKQIKKILEKNSIKTTKIGEYKRSFVLRITNQKEINKFIEVVKPNNKHHIKRYLKAVYSQENVGP